MNDSGIYPEWNTGAYEWWIHQQLEPGDILITGKQKREPTTLAAIKVAAEKCLEIEKQYGKPKNSQEL